VILLKSLLESENAVWTYTSAKPFADKIGGRIVGSVKTIGFSDNDVDILIPEYNQNISDVITEMGFSYMGSQVVSPKEIRQSRKFGRKYGIWLRNRRFENLTDHRRIEVWVVEKSGV